MRHDAGGRLCRSGGLWVRIMAAFLIVATPSSGAMAERAAAGTHLTRYSGGSAPAGFTGLCARYAWACSNSGKGNVKAGKTMLSLARSVNARLNRSIAPQSDQQAYGRSEYWTLPERGVGDCEDYALAKQKALIEQGIAPNRLYLAMVVGSPQDPHTAGVGKSWAAIQQIVKKASSDCRFVYAIPTHAKAEEVTRELNAVRG